MADAPSVTSSPVIPQWIDTTLKTVAAIGFTVVLGKFLYYIGDLMALICLILEILVMVYVINPTEETGRSSLGHIANILLTLLGLFLFVGSWRGDYMNDRHTTASNWVVVGVPFTGNVEYLNPDISRDQWRTLTIPISNGGKATFSVEYDYGGVVFDNESAPSVSDAYILSVKKAHGDPESFFQDEVEGDVKDALAARITGRPLKELSDLSIALANADSDEVKSLQDGVQARLMKHPFFLWNGFTISFRDVKVNISGKEDDDDAW